MKKSSCLYCGNNPVPHFLTWYFETLDVALSPLRQALLYNPVASVFKAVLRRLNIGWHLACFFIAIKILSVQANPVLCKVRRAQVLWEEAEKRGIRFSELLLFGKGLDLYLAEKGSEKLLVSGLPRPRNYDSKILDIIDDKPVLKKKLLQAGLPVPAGGSITSFSQALKIFRSIGKPVIVKPRTGSRGRHTTTFVYTEAELKLAVKIAKQLCYWAVVEEQLSGPVYRATIINGNLAGVLRGDPPQVTGDGKQSIAQLISAQNLQPRPGVKNIVIDSGMELFLSRQSLELSSILPAGQVVSLTEKIGVNYGGSSSEDFDICHPENKELFLRAAKVLGDPIVGFDFIIPDISAPWKVQKCGFIEANSLPFINLHHDPLLGTPRNAAALVWDMMGM